MINYELSLKSSMSDETKILDAAFELAQQATPPLGDPHGKEKLHLLFPKLSIDQVSEFYRRAANLADACYEAADQCRDMRLTDAQAIRSLHERCPGFSTETYAQALSWGYFLSR